MRHRGGRHAFEAREEAIVRVDRFGEHRWANQVDADPARQFAGCGANKPFQRRVHRGGIYPLRNRLVRHDPAYQRNRAAFVQVVLAGQRQTHLPEQLILQALVEVTVLHGRERAEVEAAAGGHNGIHRADFLKQRLNARLRGDIHLLVALRAAHADDLVATTQLIRYRTTDRTAGTNNDDFHSRLLML